VPEPLPWTAELDSSGPILVIENAATWHSYRRWNAERKLFSGIVYGCGNRFLDSATYLGEIFKSLGSSPCILYFGDLDPRGLLIPQVASIRVQEVGLPPMEPHLWSYRQLLAVARDRGQAWEGEPPSSTLCDWLGDCAEPARKLFSAGLRLPQEFVGWEHLRNHTELPTNSHNPRK
jgi:hypothetical protein